MFHIVNGNKINTKSEVAEGAISSGALPGIIRNLILDKSFLFKVNIFEKILYLPDLIDADEIFITNSLMGIKPIYKIDGKKYTNFSISMQIQDSLRKHFDYI